MFWAFILAHLIADYPLQTDAIVAAKKRLPVLALHVAIHCVTMLVILIGVLHADPHRWLLPILAVTAFHFGIDTWKNWVSARWPNWVITWYALDQLFHLLSILLVTFWVSNGTGAHPFSPPMFWIVPAIGYVWVTYVWYITERVICWNKKPYQLWVIKQMSTRMMSRVALYSALLLGWNPWALVLFVGGLTFHWLDLKGDYHYRALLLDCAAVGVLLPLELL